MHLRAAIFTIRNRKQMVGAAFGITLMSLAAMLVHVQVNYAPEMQALVRTKAAASTVIVSFPLALFFMYQMLKNQRLSEELQRLLNRDRLTDAATRDFFFDRLLEFPDAYGASLMLDIDHFKQVNDTYGHLAGDEVIRAVAEVMREQTRAEDIVCRFGGDEFVVFLHSATPQEAWTIAERIRTTIETAKTATTAGDVRVTVSVGGSLKSKLDHVDDPIKRADSCLYRAKNGGRNQTVVDWGKELH